MKTDKEIEKLLANGKKLQLNDTEKAVMKSIILQQAKKTIQNGHQSIPSPWSSWIMRSSVSFASVLLVFIGTAYASQDSLPGEPLYAMKVNVVEDMIALTKTNPEEQVAYDSVLMETRLNELKALSDQETLPPPEVVATVANQINEHVTDMTNTIASADTSELPHEKKIAALARVKALAKAQSKVVETQESLSNIKETTADAEESTSDAISATVEDFAKDKPVETVNNYLSNQIDAISDQITASTTDEETRDKVEESLHNVDESLADGSINDAIVSITEAQQIILTDKYVESTEKKDSKNDTEADTK